jgi:hypothetical protein
MVAKHRSASRGDDRHARAAIELASLLRQRESGLLNQSEYEEGLESIGLAFPPGSKLEERASRGGAVRFVVRSATGAALDSFEFQRGYRADR